MAYTQKQLDDLEAAIEEAKNKGMKMIDEVPRIGAGGVRIAFVHPKTASGILTELCEHHESSKH